MSPLGSFRTCVVAALLVASVGLGCGGASVSKASFVAPAATASAAARDAGTSVYSVVYAADDQSLAVEAVMPAGSPSTFAVEDGSERWLEATEVKASGADRFVPADRTSDGMVRAPCSAGCTLRYRYALGAAGKIRRDIDSARTDGPYVEAPPSTWLLAPVGGRDDAKVSFVVHVPEGSAFVSGFPEGEGGARLTTVGQLRRSPYSAFGPLEVVRVDDGDVTFSVALPRKGKRIAPELVIPWVKKSAAAVRAVLGKFPARHAALLVSVTSGDDVEVGFSLAGSSIVLRVGERTNKETFGRDWVLTHEMLHFACPSQPDARDWAEEGMATYIEPFARARVGLVSREEAWEGLLDGFPNGQPARGDQGLDRTRTWGRVYWGGALFFFEADYAIRTRTDGKHTVFDAFGAIVASGGTNATSWSLERAFAIGDEAVGVPVLTEMLTKYGVTGEPFSYTQHLAELGVRRGPKGVAIDASAKRSAMANEW